MQVVSLVSLVVQCFSDAACQNCNDMFEFVEVVYRNSWALFPGHAVGKLLNAGTQSSR